MDIIIDLIKNNKNIKYETKDDKLYIYNKENNNYIEIIKITYSSNKDSFIEYIISFSSQHHHFKDNIEEILEYIKDIMNDQVLPIEFYSNDKNRFGSEISFELFNNLSIKSLANYFGYSEDYISTFEFEIHSWTGKYDIKRTPVINLSK